jgi:hypothetical protein
MLALVGREVGDRWDDWRDRLHYIDYAVVLAIVALVVYLVVRRRSRGTQPPVEPAGETGR